MLIAGTQKVIKGTQCFSERYTLCMLTSQTSTRLERVHVDPTCNFCKPCNIVVWIGNRRTALLILPKSYLFIEALAHLAVPNDFISVAYCP